MIIYRTSGPWGAGKGADLTPAEADGNFHDLDTRVKTVVDNVPEPVSVDHVEMVGSTFTVHLTNGQVDGPFEIPFATLSPRGTWGPGVEYNRLDFFYYGGTSYIVMVSHLSEPSFDPAYQIAGEFVYAVALPAADQIYDIGFFIRGRVPGDESLLFRWIATRPVGFTASMTDSRAVVVTAFADAAVPPASLAIYHVAKDGGAVTRFGSIIFDQASPDGVVEFSASMAFNVGDVLEVAAPIEQDSQAADLSVTLAAVIA